MNFSYILALLSQPPPGLIIISPALHVTAAPSLYWAPWAWSEDSEITEGQVVKSNGLTRRPEPYTPVPSSAFMAPRAPRRCPRKMRLEALAPLSDRQACPDTPVQRSGQGDDVMILHSSLYFTAWRTGIPVPYLEPIDAVSSWYSWFPVLSLLALWYPPPFGPSRAIDQDTAETMLSCQ